jgi:hypothetical protein
LLQYGFGFLGVIPEVGVFAGFLLLFYLVSFGINVKGTSSGLQAAYPVP